MMKFGGSSTSQLKVEYLIPCRGIPTALVNLDFNSDCTFRLVILNNLPLAPPIPFAMDRGKDNVLTLIAVYVMRAAMRTCHLCFLFRTVERSTTNDERIFQVFSSVKL